MDSLPWTRVAVVGVGTAIASFTAYAIYFDHRRRSDPEFRRSLKRDSRRAARLAKSEAEEEGQRRKRRIKEAVESVQKEDLPSGDERDDYFLECIKQGEILSQTGGDEIESATWFYKGIKVYHQPMDLMQIYDKTVPKPILDILADMIAMDESIGGLDD